MACRGYRPIVPIFHNPSYYSGLDQGFYGSKLLTCHSVLIRKFVRLCTDTMKKVVLFISLHLFLLLNQIFDTGFLHTTHRAKPCTPKTTKNCSTLSATATVLQMLRSR